MSNLPPPPGAPGSPSSGRPSGDDSGPALWSPGNDSSPTSAPLPPPPPAPGPPAPGAPTGAWAAPTAPAVSGWGSAGSTSEWGLDTTVVHRPPAPVKVNARLGDGILVGLAASIAAGGLWWAVVAFTQRQFVYGAIAVGLLVGNGVLIGARRGGPIFGLLAAGFTLVSLAVAEYFIQRSLAISQEGYDIPLWTDLTFAIDVVREGVKGQPAIGLFWGIAAIAALLTAGLPGRRPSV